VNCERIILARGCERDPGLCARVTAAFPQAHVECQPSVPPARVALTGDESRRAAGKRTLVLGAIGRVLDQNCEPGMGEQIVCFPYRHFSAVGNCPYDCVFCYLAGNRGNLKCPAVKLYTNLNDVLAAIRKVADAAPEPVLFYGSKLQDFVALDRLTGFSRVLVPFAAAHPNVRLLFLTKAADIDGWLDLDHRGHTILSWTLNAETVVKGYETGTPSLRERLAAARRAAEAGYEVRFIFMPLIPVPGWQAAYAEALANALNAVRPTRLTLGGICMYRSALNAMVSRDDVARESLAPILDNLQPPAFPRDRYRFRPEARQELYSHLIDRARAVEPSLPISLCLETPDLWRAVGLDPAQAKCNCLP
jgi:spore photoproduct lyase